MKTNHLQVTRGETFSFTRVARDHNNAPYDLTGAEIFMSVRADMKITTFGFQLTSRDPAPGGWRKGITIENQTQKKGHYTVLMIPADTTSLIAMGHDDPWFYEITIRLDDGTTFKDVNMSNFDLYPQVGDPLAELP